VSDRAITATGRVTATTDYLCSEAIDCPLFAETSDRLGASLERPPVPAQPPLMLLRLHLVQI